MRSKPISHENVHIVESMLIGSTQGKASKVFLLPLLIPQDFGRIVSEKNLIITYVHGEDRLIQRKGNSWQLNEKGTPDPRAISLFSCLMCIGSLVIHPTLTSHSSL